MEIKISFPGNKKVDAHIGDFIIHTDQPIQGGGDNTAPSPFVMFLSSLATCAGFYVKAFCDGRGLSVEGIEIIQTMEYNHESRRIEKVIIDINLPSGFPEKYIDAVLKSANHCAVKQYLAQPFQVETIASVKK